MNKICQLSAIALLASSTSLMAQSKSFEGVSLGLSVSAIGVEVSGSTTNNTNSTTNASLGKVTEIAAVDLSYGFATGPNAIIQIGASYTPGKAKAGSGTFTDGTTTSDSTGKINLEVKDPFNIYIAPTYVVSKDSAIYAKIGYAKADVNTTATGTASLSKKPDDLEGFMYGIGSKTMLTQNLYLGIEASITDYDRVTATTLAGTDAVNSTNTKNVNADVKTAQGIITLGYKF
jgi:opacity protein-like surface antigen